MRDEQLKIKTMKKLIVIVFVLLAQISRAQSPVEKTVYYIPVQNNINSSTMPLEYNTQTTRLVHVIEVSNAVSEDSIHADNVQTIKMELAENYKLKASMSSDSTSVILEYKLESDAKVTVTIKDLRGVTIESRSTSGQQDQLTLLTREWNPGVYVASLIVEGKLIESVKFTVVK